MLKQAGYFLQDILGHMAVIEQQAADGHVKALVAKWKRMRRRQAEADTAYIGRVALQAQQFGCLQHGRARVDADDLARPFLCQDDRQGARTGPNIDYAQIWPQLRKLQQVTQALLLFRAARFCHRWEQLIIGARNCREVGGMLVAVAARCRFRLLAIGSLCRLRPMLTPVGIDQLPGAVMAAQFGDAGVQHGYGQGMGTKEVADCRRYTVAAENNSNRLTPILLHDAVQRLDQFPRIGTVLRAWFDILRSRPLVDRAHRAIPNAGQGSSFHKAARQPILHADR